MRLDPSEIVMSAAYDSAILKRMVDEKEKEWRHLAELRAERAEAELDKAQAELRTEREKFDKVKADFSYNLQLLADRDSELDAAEKTINELREDVFDRERDCSDFKAKIDALMREFEKERAAHTEQIERLRIDNEKQAKKQVAEVSAQQIALKVAKEQLEQRLAEVEANFSLTRRQLEDGFQEELQRARKSHDCQLDELRGQLAASDTEARLLARELEILRDTERKKRAELSNADRELEQARQHIRQLEWSLADKSAATQVDLKELQQKLEAIQIEREMERSSFEQRLAQTNKDLAEKVMLLERMQRSRFEDAGDAGKKIGEMQGEIARLRAITERQTNLEDELRAERESLLTYRLQLDQCESQIMALTEANSHLETTIRHIKETPSDDILKRDLHIAREKVFHAEEQSKRLHQQNENLKEAVRQMKNEVESLLQSGKILSGPPESSKPVSRDSKQTQTESMPSLLFAGSRLLDEEIPQNVDLPGDPRLRLYVDNLVKRTSSLQHRCSELVAEGRRQQIKAESAAAQLESVEHDSQRLRAALEHTRYELSAERSRFEADKLAAKKQLAELEERLAEARAIADEFHAEANDANAELAELRRRLASREFSQKSATTGVGFGGQELYIQQLEDQIKEFATRAKPQGQSEANERLKRAIAIIVQLQKDRMRLLDLAARLRSTTDDYRRQLESQEKAPKQDNANAPVEKLPLSTRSNLRPQSQLDKFETMAYEHMREKLAAQMADQRRQRTPPASGRTNLTLGDEDLSTSFPNSEAFLELFQQIDSATVALPSEHGVSSARGRTHQSPVRPVVGTGRLGSAATKSPPVKGRGRAMSRVWVTESSPPPVSRDGRAPRTGFQRK